MMNENTLNELLSLPVNFTVEPLLSMPQKTTGTSVVTLKKSRLSLDDKDQKTKERILRNRAAAQESRDKKRKYVAELESSNKQLLDDNDKMTKRAKTLEEQNASLQSQLEACSRQLATLQAQVKFNAITPILFNNFCDSARIAKKNQNNIIIFLL